MPPYAKAIERMVEKLHGGPWKWNGATGECVSEDWSEERHEEAKREAAEVWEATVWAVDWNLVMILAAGMCLKQGHEHDEWDGVCGANVRAVLLRKERKRPEIR